MTTCRDIITLALKLGKVIASGEEPSGDEAADGMACLQSLYDGWIAGGMFGRLTDVYKTEDYEAAEGERVTAPSGVTVTFPATIEDCDGDRAIRDLSCIETIVNGSRTVKVWDRTAWVSMLELTANSPAPLASRGAMGLAAALATSGAFIAMFGDEAVSPRVERMGAQFIGSLSYKLGSTRDSGQAEYY